MKIDKKKLKRVLILSLPYVFIGLLATNIGEAWRLSEGADASKKFASFFQMLGYAFGNPMPSLHPADLLFGLVFAGIIRLAVYLRGKNRKNFKHNLEYGSARWDAYYLLKEVLYGRRRRKHYDPIQQDYRAILPSFSR